MSVYNASNTSKPAAGSQLIWKHPLANGIVGCWLFNEAGSLGGRFENLADPRNPLIFDSANSVDSTWFTWAANKSGGMSLRRTSAGTGNSALRTALTGPSLDSNNWTIICHHRSSGTHPSRLIAWGGDGPTLYISTNGVYIVHSGSIDLSTSGAPLSSIEEHTVAITRRGSTARTFVDGYNRDSSTSFSVTYTLDTYFAVFGSTSFGEGRANDELSWIYAYNRGLEPWEISSLHAEPYQIFQPSPTKRLSYFTVPNPFLTESKSDDLNNWGEDLKIGIGLKPAGDNLNSWSDAIAYVYGVNVVALTRSVSDRMFNPGGPVNQRGLRDGIAFQYDNSQLFLAINDLSLFLDDDVQLTLSVFFNSVTGEAFDDLRNWADEIAIDLKVAHPPLSFSDQLVLNDQVNLLLTHLISKSDSMSLSDAVALGLFTALTAADNLNNWADSVATNLKVPGSLSVEDSLNFWMDAVATAMNTSNSDYLRRYLNDVVNP